MAYQLFVKNNLSDQDHFSSGKRYDFNDETIVIGSSQQAQCRIDDAEVAPSQITIKPGEPFQAVIHDNRLTFLNDKPLEQNQTVELNTGDILRIGHWTCRLCKIRPQVGFNPNALLLSRIVKIVVALIIVLELFVILSGSTWIGILNQRSSFLTKAQRHHHLSQQLDAINYKLKAMAEDTTFSPLEAATCKALSTEILKLRAYVLQHGFSISDTNQAQIQQLVMDYDIYIDKLKNRTLIQPVEPLQIEKTLNDLLIFPTQSQP